MMEFITASVGVEEGMALIEFISTFEASLDFRLWTKLVSEEAGEVVKAFASEGPEQQLKELADLRYVIVGTALVRSPHFAALLSEKDFAVMQDLDASYALVEDAIESSEKQFTLEQLQEAFRRVHASNMSKLDDDGNPIFREDGKILKSNNYRGPDLSDLVEQKEAA